MKSGEAGEPVESGDARVHLSQLLDMLRGMGVIGVILIHSSAHFTQASGLSPVVVGNIAVDVLAHYAVPLFMILSGIALALRYRALDGRSELTSFYRRRFVRIIPPYILFSLFYIALFAWEYSPPPLGWIAFALLTGNSYYHLWFVALLIQFYVLFPPFLRLFGWANTGTRMAGLLLFGLLLQTAWNILAPVAVHSLPQRPLFETLFSERFFVSHVGYFMLGVFIGQRPALSQRLIAGLPTWVLAVVVVILVAETTATWSYALRDFGHLELAPPLDFALSRAAEPVLFLSTIVMLGRAAERTVRAGSSAARSALENLGAHSLAIYLLHVFVQWLLARLLIGANMTPDDWLFYPVMFTVTLLVSWCAAVLLARLPYSRYLFGSPDARRSVRTA